MDVETLAAMERLFSHGGCFAVMIVALWRMPEMIRALFDFGLAIARLHADVLGRHLERNKGEIKEPET